MNCARAREQLEWYALGGLPAPIEAEVGDHVAACPDCRAVCEDYREMIAGLRKAADWAEPRPAFQAATRSLVRAQVRSARRRVWARRVGMALGAAAATVLLAVSIGYLARGRPDRPAGPPVVQMASAEQWRVDGAMVVPTSSAGGVIVRGGRMYFACRDGARSHVAAVSATTGRPVWRAQQETLGYLAADEGGVYTLARGPGRTVDLIALDSATGHVLWRFSPGVGPGLEGPCRPVPLAQGRICWTAGHTVHVLDATTGDVVWRRSYSDEGRPSFAAALGAHVYVASPAALYCLSGESGEGVWRLDVGAGETSSSRPLLTLGGGRGFVACPTFGRSSRLVCVDLANRRVLWSRTIPRPRHLLATEDVLYLRGPKVLALDAASGTPRWTRVAPGCSPMTADDGLLHLVDATDTGRLVALDRHTGREAWEILGIRSCDAFVRAGDVGLIKTADGVVHAFALRTP